MLLGITRPNAAANGRPAAAGQADTLRKEAAKQMEEARGS